MYNKTVYSFYNKIMSLILQSFIIFSDVAATCTKLINDNLTITKQCTFQLPNSFVGKNCRKLIL